MIQTDSSSLTKILGIERLLFPLAALVTLLCIHIFPDIFSPTTQLAVLGIVIVVLGLPHGALDPWIAERIGIRNNPQQVFLFTFGYVSIATLVVLIWAWLPTFSLLIFLAISAWHFSGDWKNSITQPLRLGAGALLLLMPIGFHTEIVMIIFEQLSGENGSKLAQTLALPTWLLVSAMGLFAGCAACHQQWRAAFEFLMLLALSYLTSPLIYFTVYFCFMHSPRHLLSLFVMAPPQQHSRLVRMLLTYTLVTLLLGGVLWWLWSTLPTDTLILRLIFISLAAVTVPHMMLIATAHFKTA